MARPERFELPTLWFEARCSIQLSYGRVRSILPRNILAVAYEEFACRASLGATRSFVLYIERDTAVAFLRDRTVLRVRGEDVLKSNRRAERWGCLSPLSDGIFLP